MRTLVLLIVALLLLLLGLLGWFGGSVGDGLSVPPTVTTPAAGRSVSAAPAQEPQAPQPVADCARARGIQARLSDMMERSLSFLLAAQDTLMGDVDRWPAQLDGSADPQMLYVAAGGGLGRNLTKMAPLEKVERLGRALAVDATNPMYLSSLLNLCMEHRSLAACDLPDLERRLAEFDGDNGLSWALIGASCAARDEVPCVIEAMERASQAPAYRDYYLDRVLLAERVMGAAGLSFPMRSMAAFSFASTDLLSGVRSIRACRVTEAARLDRACFHFGQRLEAQATIMLTQSHGRAVSAYAAQRLGDEQVREALRERREQLNDDLVATIDDERLAAANDVFTARLIWDREFFLEFVAHMREVGERQAYLDGAAGWGTGPPECLTPMQPIMEDDT